MYTHGKILLGKKIRKYLYECGGVYDPDLGFLVHHSKKDVDRITRGILRIVEKVIDEED